MSAPFSYQQQQPQQQQQQRQPHPNQQQQHQEPPHPIPPPDMAELERERERAQAEVTEALRETMRATRPKGIKQVRGRGGDVRRVKFTVQTLQLLTRGAAHSQVPI
jgi:hypothetical protein